MTPTKNGTFIFSHLVFTAPVQVCCWQWGGSDGIAIFSQGVMEDISTLEPKSKLTSDFDQPYW
jgi:hypothetical protein